MPIKGLLRTGQTPGLARAGVIRLGYKAKKCSCGRITEPPDSGPTCPACGARLPDNSFPREAPYFILTDAPGLAGALNTATPTALNVFFPFDEVDRVFPNYMQYWSASSLVCRGDGEQIVYAINPQTGRATVKDGVAQEAFTEGGRKFEPGQALACPGLERNLYPKCQHCKPNAMLIVMLRDVPRLAYYQISTTSIHNIVDLTQQLDYVREQVAKLTGQPRIAGVPFILRRVKRSVSVPNLDKDGQLKKDRNGKLLPPKQRTDKYFLELEIEPEWIAKMVRGIARLADPERAVGLLPATIPTPPPPAATHFAEPPAWDPRPDDEPETEVVEGEVIVMPAEPEPEPPLPANVAAGFKSMDDFLYQLKLDFQLSEAAARAKLRELGYTGWPQNGEAREKSIEMYRAVRRAVALERATAPEQLAWWNEPAKEAQ